MSTSTPAEASPSGLTHRQIMVVFSGLMLGMLLAALDQTIVATALPTITGDLGGLSHLSWVVTAYLLTSTASTPLYGKLSDLYGRKQLFQAAIVIFLIGSALAGLSHTMWQLIAFRAVQGLGGGGLIALAMAIVGDVVSPRERGRYQGYFGAVFAVSSVAGPLLGGFFTDNLSWRWIFYINIPLGIVALVVTSSVLRLPFVRVPAKVDYVGAALLVGGVVALLLVTVWGGTTYPWGSPVVVGTAVAGVLLIGVFVFWEQRCTTEPILPLRLFRISVFTVANTMAFLAGMIMFGAIIYLPAYFQLVRDVSATISGLLMLPLMGALLVASVLGGRAVSRLGRYKPFVMVGTALMTLGVWLLTHLGVHTSFVTAGLYLVPLGAGMGLSMQNLVLAIQNALPVRDMGTGTSAINFFRSMGGSFGTAVFGAVLTARLAFWLPHFVAGSAGHPVNTDIISAPAAVHRLPETVQGGISDAFVHSLHSVFWVGVPIAAATFVLSFFLAEIPLRLTSGMGEELAEGAAAALVPDELPELLDVPDTAEDAEDAGRLGSEGSDRPQSVPGGP